MQPMKTFSLTLFVLLVSFFSSGKSFAHFYDSIGVQAGPHSHDMEESDNQIKDNCFIDPELGPICK